jgi:hypothetical protein
MRTVIIAVLICFPSPIFAALINTYWLDSETELQYLFESGQIDIEQYLLLDELFSLPQHFDSAQTENILQSLKDLSDIDYLQIDSLITRKQKKPHSLWSNIRTRFSYRYYQNLDDNISNRELIYFSGDVDQRIEYDLQLEKSDDQRDLYFRRRSLSYENKNWHIQLGNFYPR